MPNKPLDIRMVRSRQFLTDALIRLMAKKPLDKITINELVKEAQVARTTFYTQFEDKSHFVKCVVEDKLTELREIVAPDFATKDVMSETQNYYVRYYEAFHENADFFKVFMGSNGLPGFTNILIQNGVRAYSEYFAAIPDEVFPMPKEYLIRYLVCANIGLSSMWMENGFKESPEYMAKIQSQLAFNGLLKGLGLDIDSILPK